jgi:hypothetical protein
MIYPEEMPSLAWDALEAGFDGPFIRRLAALDHPSGWETDQIASAFMAEAGLKRISIQDASIRIARQLANQILTEGLDPLAYTRYFELLWTRAEYPREIQDVGCLDDARSWLTDEELLKESRRVLIALTNKVSGDVDGF